MPTTVARMSKKELTQVISNVVEQKLIELLVIRMKISPCAILSVNGSFARKRPLPEVNEVSIFPPCESNSAYNCTPSSS